MITDMIDNKKLNSIVTELSIGGRKLHIFIKEKKQVKALEDIKQKEQTKAIEI